MNNEIQKKTGNGSELDVNGDARVLRPAVDIQELADSYVVRLDAPGAKKDTITAQVNGSTLTVSAKVPAYFRPDAESLFGNRSAIEYRREFVLADDVDTGTVSALYELGVLKVTLQKKRQFLPKQIQIG